jgi:hypothetical protein
MYVPFAPSSHLHQREQLLISVQFIRGGSHGSGTIRDVVTRLVNLGSARDLMILNPAGNHKSVRPIDELAASTSRQVRLTLLGIISLFHLVWARAGPDPINPFLLFASLSRDRSELVDRHFVKHLDDGERVDDFFVALDSLEERRKDGSREVLKAMQLQLLAKEWQVSIGHRNTKSLQLTIRRWKTWKTQESH